MKQSSNAYISSTSPQKIPRPMNCFMTYRVEKQQQIVDQCPGANHRDISKIVAKWWRELPAAEKEPYRLKAAKAKAEHLAKYPEYKFCPKKKATKPRPYKKRPENEFTARDFENKHQLFSLYHEGKLPDPSNPRPTQYNESEFLLDNKPPKKTSTKPAKVTKKSSSLLLDQHQYPSPTHSHPGSNPSQEPFSHIHHQHLLHHHPQDTMTLQYPSPYTTGHLFPSVNMYYGGSVYSTSPSPYPTTQAYTTLTDDTVVTEDGNTTPPTTSTTATTNTPTTTSSASVTSSSAAAAAATAAATAVAPVNYQLYSDHYGYTTAEPAYSYPVQYHYTEPTPYYGYNAVFVDPATCHPLESHHAEAINFDTAFSTAPALLTTPFYYQ
ncbi:hypothetical protein BD770DRAFT_446158 [Pilaira anomala]|nr:hypothetical protein BD770DRAFT_446158 [Pilaira anomala]